MKFQELFKVMDPDTKLAIDFKYNRYTYKVEELEADFLFYEEIKDREVTSVYYSTTYNAIVIELF